MKLAVVYDDGAVMVQFEERTFRELLKTYLEQYKDIDIAFDKVIADLKERTKYV